MTSTHVRKILADILTRRGRTILVCASIFVGVLGVITLFTVRNIITEKQANDIKASEIAMVDVLVNVNDESVDNEAALTRLREIEGLTVVEGKAFFPISFGKDSNNITKTAELRAYSSPFGGIQIEPIQLLEGNFPTPGQNQLVLEQRFVDAQGFELGDTIYLQSATEALPYEVVGIVFDPYSYRAPTSFGGFSLGPESGIYVEFEDAQSVLGVEGYSSIHARFSSFEQAEAKFGEFQQIVKDETEYEILVPTLEDPENSFQIAYAENFNNVLTMLSFVAMLVSGFLVINVINAIVVEQKRQIGSMKSVGASTRDIFMIYLGLAVTYGFIGTALAILPAIVLGNQAAHGLAPQLDVLLTEFGWSPSAVMIGVLLGLVIPAFSALIPVFNAIRVTIIEAITDLGISGGYGTGPIARIINQLPFPITVRQALNNVNRKKGRLALTGLTLTLAVAAFMGVTAVGISLTNVTNETFDRINYQLLVVPDKFTNPEETKTIIEGVDVIETAHIGSLVAVQLEGDYVNFFTRNNQLVLFGIDPTIEVFQFELEEGTGWQEDPNREGTVLSSTLAEQLDLGVGDEFRFNYNDQPFSVEIIGVDTLSFDFAWLKWEFLSETVGFVAPEFLGGEPVSNTFYVDLNIDNPSVEQVNEAFDEVGAALLDENIKIQTSSNQVEQKIQTADLTAQFIGILNLASTLIAMVGAIGLLTSLAMAVFERQKEIGVMRSMGGSSRIIVTQFLMEGILVGFIAWVIAIPLSYGIALAVNSALGVDAFKFTYPFEVIVLGLAGMLIISSFASIGPSLNAARKTVSSILRYQ